MELSCSQEILNKTFSPPQINLIKLFNIFDKTPLGETG